MKFTIANKRGGCMISAWWLIPAFFLGEFVGILAIAIISGRGGGDE